MMKIDSMLNANLFMIILLAAIYTGPAEAKAFHLAPRTHLSEDNFSIPIHLSEKDILSQRGSQSIIFHHPQDSNHIIKVFNQDLGLKREHIEILVESVREASMLNRKGNYALVDMVLVQVNFEGVDGWGIMSPRIKGKSIPFSPELDSIDNSIALDIFNGAKSVFERFPLFNRKKEGERYFMADYVTNVAGISSSGSMRLNENNYILEDKSGIPVNIDPVNVFFLKNLVAYKSFSTRCFDAGFLQSDGNGRFGNKHFLQLLSEVAEILLAKGESGRMLFYELEDRLKVRYGFNERSFGRQSDLWNQFQLGDIFLELAEIIFGRSYQICFNNVEVRDMTLHLSYQNHQKDDGSTSSQNIVSYDLPIPYKPLMRAFKKLVDSKFNDPRSRQRCLAALVQQELKGYVPKESISTQKRSRSFIKDFLNPRKFFLFLGDRFFKSA